MNETAPSYANNTCRGGTFASYGTGNPSTPG